MDVHPGEGEARRGGHALGGPCQVLAARGDWLRKNLAKFRWLQKLGQKPTDGVRGFAVWLGGTISEKRL
jgi:hypothetical protein